MIHFNQIDFKENIRDFDYTLRSMQNMKRIIDSKEFKSMDSDVIFKYLLEEAELVSFQDYLKRYIYKEAQITAPFCTISDIMYQEIIAESFREKSAPYSFSHTTKRLSATVRSWLQQKSARREVVFLLGFGLRMSPEDVSDFLMKVLKEHNFNFYDPEETIFWYCYQHEFPYSKARYLYQQLQLADINENYVSEITDISQIHTDKQLLDYIIQIQKKKSYMDYTSIAYCEFCSLLEKSKGIIADIYSNTASYSFMEKNSKWTKEDIMISDVEKILCSGFPVGPHGNIKKASASLLSEHFQQKKFSRQHIDAVLRKRLQVNRFDLITLLFFIHSQTAIHKQPNERFCQFVDEMNQILTKCGMLELYPVNAYEGFILMCLLSDCPLAVYTEVWEMSYQETVPIKEE